MRMLSCGFLLAIVIVSATAVDVTTVEGVMVFPRSDPDLLANTRVLLNYGKYVGFPLEDGTFQIGGVVPGSYIIQIENVDYVFEPVRVDIATSGKMRARKMSVLKPGEVIQLPYPLKMQAREATRYFRKREEWRITDMLMSPMVLMLALPLVLTLILPKLTDNNPELQREMESMQMPKVDMPDVSDMMANFFGGPAKPKKKAVGAGPSGSGSGSKRK